ncbi:hypothetical protein EV193_102519 [Herbihabitans rhizosphaerae]|uniref:Dynamin family protein n=1 Tax=Herbihabitans rhizosphaerae TaxID=1872711 RepID=A0A4Q7L1Y6_9PSEU|nr:hypothetical protein [Herbihabitans rhizosphaerae]RZS43539.1 hypothetical protein EV193_102519 [Herbihabitans rhizosphaerae]
MTGLAPAVHHLLLRAAEVFQDVPRARAWLHGQLERWEEPLRLAIAGGRQTGKSTLVNALIGERLCPPGPGDAPVWIHGAPTAEAIMYPSGGPPVSGLIRREGDRSRVDPDAWPDGPLDRVDLRWPARSLRGLTLLDAVAPDDAEPTDARVFAAADAVLYLVRQAALPEIAPVRAACDRAPTGAGAVGSMVVLARADEVGGGRIDALTSAKQVARGHRDRVEVRQVCQDVIAVAGLLALAGRTMTELDFDSLCQVAAVPRADLEPALLSADRFAGASFPAPLPPEVRAELLDRYGLFGVRLAVTLIRTGSTSKAALAAELVRRSGIGDLRESIGRLFTDRADVLKARTALAALGPLLRTETGPGANELAAELERIVAGAHEFRELRTLAALDSMAFTEELADEVRRLIGGFGVAPVIRLGLHEDATDSDLEAEAWDMLHRWRENAERPDWTVAQRQAAHVVVRTCEELAMR